VSDSAAIDDVLTAVLGDPANRGRIAVFDFDGTIIDADITETVVDSAWRTGGLDTEPFWRALGAGRVDGGPEESRDPFATYLEIADSDTVEGYPFGHHASSSLVAQAFAGRSVGDVIQLTREVLAPGGGVHVRAPIIELLRGLLAAGIEVRVISAGVTWCVRTALQVLVNPLLQDTGTIDPRGVAGITPLMGAQARWWTDRQMLAGPQGAAYADCIDAELADVMSTATITGPFTFGGGKVGAWVEEFAGQVPVLMVGDGAGDGPLMRLAEHALWVRTDPGQVRPAAIPDTALVFDP
jgi:phosphoserine phosphatase